jgi:hypothetical protein
MNDWLVVYLPGPSEKYQFVSWDDDIPNMESHKSHVPNHQNDRHTGTKSMEQGRCGDGWLQNDRTGCTFSRL